MEITKFSRYGILSLFVFAAILLAGCKSDPYDFNPLAPPAATTGTGGGQSSAAPNNPTNNNSRPGVLQVGDEVTVTFADLPNPISPIDEQIKSDGTITLNYNEKFEAAGKTPGELQAEIRQRYVPKYFVNMTPTVKVQDRFYSVGGEVRSPNRFLWTGSMTILQAINTAGGFTDFANKGKVTLTRVSGAQFQINCRKALDHPELDLPVYPGDKINVKKRLW